jgi:hypothetical protein
MSWLSLCVLLGAAATWVAWHVLTKHPVERPVEPTAPVDDERARFDAEFAEIAAAAEEQWRRDEGLRALGDYARQYPMKQRPGVVAPADPEIPTTGDQS